MAERRFDIILRFASRVPSMATCASCHYKFITPSTLKGPMRRLREFLTLGYCLLNLTTAAGPLC
jgi:hypothetical protein